MAIWRPATPLSWARLAVCWNVWRAACRARNDPRPARSRGGRACRLNSPTRPPTRRPAPSADGMAPRSVPVVPCVPAKGSRPARHVAANRCGAGRCRAPMRRPMPFCWTAGTWQTRCLRWPSWRNRSGARCDEPAVPARNRCRKRGRERHVAWGRVHRHFQHQNGQTPSRNGHEPLLFQ